MVIKVIGWLLMVEACFMLFPMAVSWLYEEPDSVHAFAVSAAITFGSGMLMTFGTRPRRNTMFTRDGLLITAFVWVVFSAFGMIPFLLTKAHTSITDAYFETMSGFTTTGSTIFADVESLSHGLLLWRSLTQWIGGMGIILFTLAVLPMLNSQGGIRLFNAEVSGLSHDKLRPRISQTAKSLWMVYIVLTFAAFGLLILGPMGWFDALCHALSTVSTGGYSTKNASIGAWSSLYIYGVIAVFMFLGGTSFGLMYRSISQRTHLWKSETFCWYAIMIIVVAGLVGTKMCLTDNQPDALHSFANAIFSVVTVMTSTGLTTIDYEQLGGFVSMAIFLLMFFGGMAGSTTGGAKIDRLILLIKSIRATFYNVLHPYTVTPIRINSRIVPAQVVNKSIAFLSVYLFVVIMGGVVLSVFDMPVYDSLFTSLSMTSNIGVGHGGTGINGSFANLPDMCKWVLSFLMLVGRLEVYTVLIIFTKGFWKR